MEQQSTLDAVCGCIRAESKEGRLCPLSSMPGLVSAALAGSEAAAPGSLPSAEAIETLLATEAPDDVKLMRGASEIYYFSEFSMTAAYAKHLFRVSEKDPPKLIADTARDESKTYPRPTLLRTFLDPPFTLSRDELDEALAAIARRPEFSDIRRCVASNGDEYVYSDAHLSRPHAESLAEWASVGEKENP